MSREEIIKMMAEVGAKPGRATPTTFNGFVDVFESFAALVAAAEREKCANICDEADALMNSTFQGVAQAIRARGGE
jgi:KaiC/GvpD/RAD55 family RecA-like ATPase